MPKCPNRVKSADFGMLGACPVWGHSGNAGSLLMMPAEARNPRGHGAVRLCPPYGYGYFARGAAEGPPKKRKKRESGGNTRRVLSGFKAAS
jgi:hypothetical protein